MSGRDVFGPCDDLFDCLMAHRYMDHVGPASLGMNYTYPSMVTSMGHAFVN